LLRRILPSGNKRSIFDEDLGLKCTGCGLKFELPWPATVKKGRAPSQRGQTTPPDNAEIKRYKGAKTRKARKRKPSPTDLQADPEVGYPVVAPTPILENPKEGEPPSVTVPIRGEIQTPDAIESTSTPNEMSVRNSTAIGMVAPKLVPPSHRKTDLIAIMLVLAALLLLLSQLRI
jgi:hypothetical protein